MPTRPILERARRPGVHPRLLHIPLDRARLAGARRS